MEIAPEDELRARLAEAADNSKVPDIAREALTLLRPSIALTPAQSSGAGRTRFGGLPPIPAGTEWPTFDGRPLTFLAQLDCAALHPLLGGDWPLPREGLLLFFFDDTFADFEGSDARVLHVPSGTPERPAPPDATVMPAVPVAASYSLDLPDSTDPAVDALEGHDLIDAMDAVETLAAVLPRVDYRLLGWYGGGRPDQRPLLQLESLDGTDWGEIVNVSFWVSAEDLAAGRLDRVTRAIEVA
ncbi:YwqG family protein [Spirillospora sp. NPDC047279]|uniref:YwqG family protein n=1 Tax=Spirillospora sp. NPDC047279 TaxID=3155478 RepID=UPI0033F7A6AC